MTASNEQSPQPEGSSHAQKDDLDTSPAPTTSQKWTELSKLGFFVGAGIILGYMAALAVNSMPPLWKVLTSIGLLILFAVAGGIYIRELAKIARRRRPPLGEVADVKVTKDLLKHVDTLFHTRLNFLLAVEALFFNGVARLFEQNNTVGVIISIGGTILTLLFFATLLNLSEKLVWLQDQVTKKDKDLYAVYRDVRFWPAFDTRIFYTFVIPGFLILAWLASTAYFGFRIDPTIPTPTPTPSVTATMTATLSPTATLTPPPSQSPTLTATP